MTETTPGQPLGWLLAYTTPAGTHHTEWSGDMFATRADAEEDLAKDPGEAPWRVVAVVEADALPLVADGSWGVNAVNQMARADEAIHQLADVVVSTGLARDLAVRLEQDAAETRRHLTAVLGAIAAGELCSPRYDRVTEAREFLAGTGRPVSAQQADGPFCEVCEEGLTVDCSCDGEEDCVWCGGSGWVVPEHCCTCGGSPYCACCKRCGRCVGVCGCPVEVQMSDGSVKTL